MIRKTVLFIIGVLFLSGSITLISFHHKSWFFFIPTGLVFITVARKIPPHNEKAYRRKLALYRLRLLMKGRSDDQIARRLSLMRFVYGIKG